MSQANPHVAAMAAYQLAEMVAPPGLPLISLAQNESLRPPSPRAVAAAAQVLSEGAAYPDPDWTGLRQALGAHHQIDPQMILCGSGSLDLIGALARTYAGPDRAILAPAHSYPFFRSAAQMADAPYCEAPDQNGTACVDRLLAEVTPQTAIVFIANPGNPTGTRLPRATLRDLRARLPGDVLLVIDEAYGEFADGLDAPCFDMAETGNTVLLRTFSKAYALAGCRVGWGIFPPHIAEQVRKVMNPNNISAASQAAAQAALEDAAYMQETCAQTAALREAAAAQLRAGGLTIWPSFTNFLLIGFNTVEQAAAVDTALKAQGIFLRAQGGAGLPHCLRMTIARAADTERATDALLAAYGEIRA